MRIPFSNTDQAINWNSLKMLSVFILPWFFLDHIVSAMWSSEKPPTSWYLPLVAAALVEDFLTVICILTLLNVVNFKITVRWHRLGILLSLCVLWVSLMPVIVDLCVLVTTGTRVSSDVVNEVIANGVAFAVVVSINAAWSVLHPALSGLCALVILTWIISIPVFVIMLDTHDLLGTRQRYIAKQKTVMRELVGCWVAVSICTFLVHCEYTLAQHMGITLDHGNLAVHIFNNSLLCLVVVQGNSAISSSTIMCAPSNTDIKNYQRYDEIFFSDREQYVLPLKEKQNKCMVRKTIGFEGSTYVKLSNNSAVNPPNIIAFVLESARFHEFTSGLQLVHGLHSTPLTPTMNSLISRGLLWDQYFTVNFNSLPAFLPASTGRISKVAGPPNHNPRLYGFEDALHKRMNYQLHRLTPMGYNSQHPLFKQTAWAGRVSGTGYGIRDLDLVDLVDEALTLDIEGSSHRPYYYEVRSDGTHVDWSISDQDVPLFRGKEKQYQQLAKEQLYMMLPESTNNNNKANSNKKLEQLYVRMLKTVHLADKMIGDILQRLRDRDAMNNTLVVVTGDHAYSLMHSIFQTEYDEQYHVPLLIADLNGDVLTQYTPGSRISDIASNVDYGSTLLDLLGVHNYTNHGIGHSLIRRPRLARDKSNGFMTEHWPYKGTNKTTPIRRERITLSQIQDATILRNNTHSSIYSRAEDGQGWEVRTYNRKEDPYQRRKPTECKTIPYDNINELHYLKEFLFLTEYWKAGASSCPLQHAYKPKK
eukprot:CFRG3151T1